MRYILILVSVALCVNVGCFQDPLENTCPDAQDIAPCTCDDHISHSMFLYCKNIYNADVLRNVFYNSQRYPYKTVVIQNSVFPYIPHEIFQKTPVTALLLEDSTFVQLFDSAPEVVQTITDVQLTRLEISRGISWSSFERMSNMDTLRVEDTSIDILDPSFSRYMSKTLHFLFLTRTETTKIKPGALAKFVNLIEFVFDSNAITGLTRDIFPRPFNVEILSFERNKIAAIPNDLFTDMPKLELVDLRSNFISVVPQSAFQGSSVGTFALDNNPLKCNCLLQWIVKKQQIQNVQGICVAPKRLKGRNLRDLSPSDFDCQL